MRSKWKQSGWVARSTALVFVLVVLAAGLASAQVPQHGAFTGRLVDEVGSPLAGPVALELRVFDAETSGTEIFAELHSDVPLDATGAFGVQLGLGTALRTSLFCPPDCDAASLFRDPNRWLEVAVGIEVLTPRVRIGAVPWALIAEKANKIEPNPNAPRFEDCGDGTLADHQTGLQWEKKTGAPGTPVDCTNFSTCTEFHDSNNRYIWQSIAGPDGSAFSNYLRHLNPDPSVSLTPAEAVGDPALDPSICFVRHCDWRLPAIGELRTLLVGPDAAPGQSATCSAAPCVDPDFASVGGPTVASFYWSSSSAYLPDSDFAYGVDFAANPPYGAVYQLHKSESWYVRAVRNGSCD